MGTDPYLELADWRRRVAELYATWRRDGALDPERATAAFRRARDELFATHPQSPLPPERRGRRGDGPTWWPYDPAWRMTAEVEPIAGPGPHDDADPTRPDSDTGAIGGRLEVPSSGSGTFSVRPVGRVRLHGPLEGQTLSLLWIEGYGNGLFLPFRDATSGHETYGAGRYLLDTVKGADHGGDAVAGTLLLDFNLAYQPSCACDPRWACPLAPPANRLSIPVTVGERLP